MAHQTLTLNIPDDLYSRLEKRAAAAHRTVEAEVLDVVAGAVADEELPGNVAGADNKTLWLSVVQQPDYVWEYRHKGATDHELEMLEAALGRPLPVDYRAFLKLSNGAGLSRAGLWRIRLWPALNIPDWSRGYGLVPEHIAGAVAFGDDYGEEALVFDMRPEHPDGQYPIVRVNYYDLEWDAAIHVADDFKSLILRKEPLF